MHVSFCYYIASYDYTPQIWNDLPCNTKTTPSTRTFKSRLKTHLFHLHCLN